MSEPDDLNEPTLRDRAVAAARGDAPFDLLIAGADIACPLTGRLRAVDVGTTGPLIASVHPRGTRTDATETLDATARVLAPGLIDMHIHVESSMVMPAVYAEAVIARGVTTVVWDPHEIANVAGIDGMAEARRLAEGTPLRLLMLAPSCVPSAPGYETAGAEFGPDAITTLLAHDDIAGLAEVMDMAGVVGRGPRMRSIVQAGLSSGKPVCGHARGLTGAALQAYAAAGVASDHELTSAADLLEKLAAGLTIELRGSHPYLLPEFAAALQCLPAMPPSVTLCSDDVFPDDLRDRGTVDETLRALVVHGLDPLRALQAATYNAAMRLGRPDLGLVAAGRRADLVLFDDLRSFDATAVWRDGKRVDGWTAPPAQTVADGLRLDPPDPSDFTVAAEGQTARVATVDRPRFTQWGERAMPVVDGRVAPPPDVTTIAVINRHGGPAAKPAVGFLTGWGTWCGAFATTVSHDSHNLTVFGHDPEDMAIAARCLIEAGGGMVAVQDGAPLALLRLGYLGLMAQAPLGPIASDFEAVRRAMGSVVAWEPPYLTFKALVGATLACNAGPHQTDLGIADPLAGRLLRSPLLDA